MPGGKHYVVRIFIDLSKAFNSLGHKILPYKLECVGVREVLLKLFQSYLINRKQCVKPIEKGIKQGYLLGPIPFDIYTWLS